MADKTKIEWTDATWNPITGCSRVSPGCEHCYAERLAGTRLKHHWSRKGLTRPGPDGPIWTGEVRLNEEWMDQPLRWKKPRRVFVCAHADLFHENVPDEWLDRVFEVMAMAQRHTFQVLTKRPAKMFEYIKDVSLAPTDERQRHLGPKWPLPNVWLGVSAENQECANNRIPALLATPAAVRWVSVEPLLGPVDLTNIPIQMKGGLVYGRNAINSTACGMDYPALDWVVVGGESGPGYRPMNPDWARSIRDQCGNADVPFFMKQMAGKKPIPDDLMIREYPATIS